MVDLVLVICYSKSLAERFFFYSMVAVDRPMFCKWGCDEVEVL